jgi:Ca2+-binding EF-hand superfamily protein
VTSEVRAKAFTRWDTNKDDRLSLEEYQAGLKGEDNLEARFNNFDQNSDGKLTREEFVGTAARQPREPLVLPTQA